MTHLLFFHNKTLHSRQTEAVQHKIGYWMGATNVKDGQWKWINDLSKVQYSNWIPGQPDNSNGVEDCACFLKANNYNWNDASSKKDGLGYICERTRVSK